MIESSNPTIYEESSSKDTFSLENTKKKRDEYLVEIRAQHREQILTNKRMKNMIKDRQLNMINTKNEQIFCEEKDDDSELSDYINICLKKPYRVEELDQLILDINSEDRFRQHYGVIGLRKLLSSGGSIIQQVIDTGVIPRLLAFMDIDAEPHLQLESAWSLVNVASGERIQTKCIVEKGAIPRFVKLLKNLNLDIAEQAAWGIGNIAGDSPEYRDAVIAYGALEPLCELVQRAKNQKQDAIVKNGVWALSNLCRGKPLPEFNKVKNAIPILSRVLQEEYDLEVLSDASWALLHLSDKDVSEENKIVKTGIFPTLIRNIDNPYLAILVPTLRMMGNLLSGEETLNSKLLLQTPGVISKLAKLITHIKKAVRREVCWTLCNIAAEEPSHIDLILNEPNLVKELIKCALSDTFEVQKEAAWTLANATYNADQGQIVRMVKLGMLDALATLIKHEEPDLIECSLEGLDNFIRWGKTIGDQEGTENKILIHLEQVGIVKKIEDLQHHAKSYIYEKALKIIEENYSTELLL